MIGSVVAISYLQKKQNIDRAQTIRVVILFKIYPIANILGLSSKSDRRKKFAFKFISP